MRLNVKIRFCLSYTLEKVVLLCYNLKVYYKGEKDMNIINAIYNLVNNPIVEIVSHYSGKNRANNAGDALEEYVKDLFANSFNLPENEKLDRWNKVFSYFGNNSNPPDAMLYGGDAIEIKKLETDNKELALNSSYPKHTLKSDSTMISNACRIAENWTEKDIIYAVGVVRQKALVNLCFVYGLDYCASDECYSRVRRKIKDGVESIQGIEFSETRELGKIHRVDPLGITYLRVRGMWGIVNPWSVFSYVCSRNVTKKFNFMCLINEDKWKTFDNVGLISNISKKGFSITDVRIKNPDNPADLRNAKLIQFVID